VTAERIRDKIAASKKKGLWMGGMPPLGYDPHPDPNRRELVNDAAEAEVVRRLFALHAEHGLAIARSTSTPHQHRTRKTTLARSRGQLPTFSRRNPKIKRVRELSGPRQGGAMPGNG